MAADDWVEQPPGGGGFAETAQDFARSAVNAATFGMSDRAMAGLQAGARGTTYDEELKNTVGLSEAARERSPYASIAGDVAGSLTTPGLGAAGLAARMGGRALARGAAYGGTGLITGAAQGAGNTYTGNANDYVRNAALGGAFGGVLGGLGGAAFARGPRVTAAETPDVNTLYHAKNLDYDNLARSSVPYDARALATRADDVEHGLRAERFHERDSPGTWRGLDEMREPAAAIGTGVPPVQSAFVDPAGIEFIRKGINKIPKTAERAVDRESGRHIKDALDDFVINPPPGAVPPGYAAAAREASELGTRARANNAGYRRAQAFDDLITAATDKGGSNYSGLNLENALRNATTGFIKPTRGVSKASKEGFNRDEVAALRRFARGENERGSRMTGGNLLRWGAKTAGGGSGLGFLSAAGLGLGGGAVYNQADPGTTLVTGAALPLTGLGLRVLGNRRANANIRQLQEMINQRNPHYQDLLATSPMLPGPGSPGAAKAARDAVALQLLRMQGQPADDKWE